MGRLINLFVFPIAFILENHRRLIASVLTIALVIIPAYLIGSMIYAEAKLDEIKVVREEPGPKVIKKGLQTSRFIGPNVSNSKVISSLEDARSVREEGK